MADYASTSEDKGIQHAPPFSAQTGALQFGADWPGLFIRGDTALHLAAQLGSGNPTAIGFAIHRLVPLLRSCYEKPADG